MSWKWFWLAVASLLVVLSVIVLIQPIFELSIVWRAVLQWAFLIPAYLICWAYGLTDNYYYR